MGEIFTIELPEIYIPWTTYSSDYDGAREEVNSLYAVFWGGRPYMGKEYILPRHDEALKMLTDLMERFADGHKAELEGAMAWHNSEAMGAIPINRSQGWPTVEESWPVESFLQSMQRLHTGWSEIAHPADEPG